jgi:TadE-like protein
MRSRLESQRGQAMAEFVVISGVLIFVFFGIWYLGKYHDIQASAIQATRYAVGWPLSATPHLSLNGAALHCKRSSKSSKAVLA